MFCSHQKGDANTLMYTFPPSIACSNINSTTSPVNSTYYTLTAKDLNKDQDTNLPMNYSVTDNGIWENEQWLKNHHIYYIPFKDQTKQQELPAVPGLTNDELLQYNIYPGSNGSADTIISCSFNDYDGKSGLRAQITKYANDAWTWSSPNASTQVPTGDICGISSEIDNSPSQTSSAVAYNPVHNVLYQNEPTWIYPTPLKTVATQRKK